MLSQVLLFLLETFMGLFALALLLRFHMQWLRAPVRNPVSQFLNALTDWLVVPARRWIPGLRGFDWSTLTLAWLTELVLILATFWLRGFSFVGPIGLDIVLIALLALIQIWKLSLYILMVAVVVQAVLSWVSPYSPAAPLLNSIARPFLRVFQKRIPPVGNVDLSPLFVLVVCQIVLMATAWLESGVVHGIG
jgi:YggT family protein